MSIKQILYRIALADGYDIVAGSRILAERIDAADPACALSARRW